jgi:hypothetical protein
MPMGSLSCSLVERPNVLARITGLLFPCRSRWAATRWLPVVQMSSSNPRLPGALVLARPHPKAAAQDGVIFGRHDQGLDRGPPVVAFGFLTGLL